MKILIPTAKELNKKATPQEALELSEKSNEIVAEFAKLSVSDLAKVYKNIDRDNFDEADKEYIEKNVFITTSLYGIIGACDLIQEHRLDFLQNVKISGESLKNFWRVSYDESIEDEDFVVSLLSSEFEEVFSKNQKEKFIKISFMEEKEGKLKVHSTISKKARGKFLTELVKNKVSSVEEMKKIKFDGFEFSKEHSEEKVLAFIAKK